MLWKDRLPPSRLALIAGVIRHGILDRDPDTQNAEIQLFDFGRDEKGHPRKLRIVREPKLEIPSLEKINEQLSILVNALRILGELGDEKAASYIREDDDLFGK